jgi:hypothetical protein
MASKPFGLAASVNSQMGSGSVAPAAPWNGQLTSFFIQSYLSNAWKTAWTWQTLKDSYNTQWTGSKCTCSIVQGGISLYTGPPGANNRGGLFMRGPASSCPDRLESNGRFQSQVLTQVLVGHNNAGDVIERLQAGVDYELRITFAARWRDSSGVGTPSWNPAFEPGTYGFGPNVNQGKIWINTGHNAGITAPSGNLTCTTNSSTYDHEGGPSNPGGDHCTDAPTYWIEDGVYTNPSANPPREWRFYNLGGGCPQLITFPSWFTAAGNTTDWTYTYSFTAIGPSGNTLSGGGHMNIEQLVIEFESYCQQSVLMSDVCIVEIPPGGGGGGGGGGGSGAISGPNTTTSSTY